MARSSLMRWVKALARQQAIRQRFGDAREDVAAANAAWRLSRRDLMRGAALTAGVAAGLAPPKTRAAQPAKIVIVGAGIAGMSAALALADHGVASTIYEASGRIGGRMHSETSYWNYDNFSPVSEYCGELIDSGHQKIMRLASRFGLTLDDLHAAEPPGSTETYYLQTSPNSAMFEYYTAAAALADFAPVFQAATNDANAAGYPTLWNNHNSYGKMLDEMSVFDWIASRVPGGLSSPMGRLLNVAYGEEYGALTTDQSSLNLIYLLAYQPDDAGFSIFGVSDERFHIQGGNARLPLAIAEHLEIGGMATILTGHRLVSIAQANGKVTLDFQHGQKQSQVIADQAILTLPFSVLRTLDYSGAQFNALKQKAIAELGSGRNAKMILQFTSRYWNQSGPWGVSTGEAYTDRGFEYFSQSGKYKDVGLQNTWDTSRAQPGPFGLLTNYTGAGGAESFHVSHPYLTASDPKTQSFAARSVAELENIFPGITPAWTGKAVLSTPYRDPNLLLSYSYWRVGQYTSFAGYERVPQGAIHFAGEHCSINFQGFMEGGAQEGARAAREVLATIGV